jgi:hypothetical protein
LKLEAAEAAAGLPTRLQEVKYKALREWQPRPAKHCRD